MSQNGAFQFIEKHIESAFEVVDVDGCGVVGFFAVLSQNGDLNLPEIISDAFWEWRTGDTD